ncbi:uncharacterized protein LOC123312969 [Coccinella septempunctata]|uniref:uncharacterized protein LOC123312969 n=1 Tax=Coccinella septempunctata TaxID=41139 RepID=UPI001D06A01A|nr:uncharacterized protein LOC123312969 [Coccinella septempunctata]
MNYSKGSPRKDSGSSTLNCNQSLFMDESSEDLENYLNTPLPKNSSVGDGDEILYFEQDIECSTINALSKNIKGKFHRSSKDSKKNKFFKSKSSEEKPTVHSNEIPMINEAMKKILKDTPCKPQLKHSPKALKTYSNKHKDKSLVVESFGLPDEPFVSVDTSNLNEQDSIDLDAKTDDDSFDISSLFSSWIFNQTEPSEININEDFRRKSFSTIQNIPLGEASVETEVREGFNFEEDVLIPDVKSSTKKNIIDGKRCPVVFLKPFNFNDIRQFEANNLSPLKNRKQSLLERWNKFHSKLNDSMLSDKSEVSKSKPQIKTSNIVKCVASKTYSRRSTRLNNLSVDSEGLDNTSHSKETHNASNIKEQNLLHNSSKKIEEKEEKKTEEPISSKFPVFDILSPRRSMRRSGQQAVDPLSVNTSKQIGNNKDHPKVSPSKLQRVSLTKHKTENVSKNDIAAKRSFKLDNTTSDKMKNEGIIEEKSSEQILMRNIDVLNASQISSRISSKTSPVKKLSNQKDTDVHQNTDTSVRKSHRLKPKSDKISVNPSGTSCTLENATNMEVCSADSSLNETDANMNTSIEEGVVISELDTKATVKKRRGRPPKAKVGLVGTSVLSEPLENGIANDKLRKHTKKDEEEISTELLVIRRSNNDEKDKGELKEGKNSDISKQGCFKMDDNNILLKNSNFLKLDSQSQNNGKDIQNKIKPINKIVLNGSNDSKNNDETTSIPHIQEPLKRKRGRPRKIIIGLKEPEPKSITESTDKEMKHANSDILNDINHETKTDKYSNIMKSQDKIRDNTDEAKKKEEQESSTVLNHCEKKVVSQTNGISNKLLCKTSEPLGDVAENKHFDGISDEATEPCKEKKQKVSKESTENIENISNSLVKEKKTSEISIPEKPSDQENKSETKIKIDQKTEIKSDYLEQCNKSNAINYDSMNEKKEVDEAYSTSTKLLDKSESIVQPPNDTKTTERYFDFGYDIHRRTSFRKILERVMEASRLEMETMKSGELRTQRCKSVPHEEFHCGREASDIYFKTFSADSKLKYLKDKKNANLNIKNVDFSKVRKRLDYNIVSKSQDSNFSMRKRTKSFHAAVVGSNDKAKYTDIETSFKPISNSIRQKEEIIKDISLIVSAQSSSENVTKEIEQTNTDSNCEKDICEEKSRKNNSVSGQIISTNSAEKNLDQNDLEVENLLLGKISSDKFYERRRCKSFSEASHRNKVIPKSKSVMKKKLKKNRAADAVESPILNNIKKVHEFKVGDLVWGKIGNYPYWPGLVVEDPETSDFKKIRLLRTTPYYHVRFFGDKGKRAWTLHCIPFETADDLDVLREQSRAEGAQSSDFVVRASHKEKWRRAVKEAETVKNEPVEKKLGFFDRILSSKEILEDRNDFESEDNPKESFKLVRSKSFSCLNKDMRNQFKTNKTIEKPKVPMKVSSLLACIENVVKNNSVESFEPGSTSSPPNKKSPLKQPSVTDCNEDKSDYSARDVKKTIRSSKDSPSKSPSRKRNISTKESSVLSCIDDVVSCSQGPQCSSEDFDEGKTKQSPDLEAVNNRKLDTNQNSPKAMTTNRTPVSRRKNSEAFFQRTRLRTGHLERRRLTQEFKQDDESKESKASVECSPRRMKLKRRTIAVVQSNGMVPVDNVLLNDCVSRLSEHKKNIFRGVPKEKVCQICEKSGEVVKCRGPCNGDFHVKCIENSLKVTEECTLKEEIALKEKDGMSDNNKQVEISTIVSRKKFVDNVILSPVNNKVPMIEQFDRKMKELMNHVESRISIESSESSIEDLDADKNRSVQDKNGKKPKKSRGSFKHVTADDVREINLFDSEISKSKAEISEQMMYADEVYKCPYCTSTVIPPCFVCNSIVSKKGSTMRQRCSLQKCGRYYHLECLNVWHQTQWSFILHDKRKTEAFDSFVCPRHSCHICASENSGFSMGRCPNDKLVKCLRCPATYHNSYHCVPAGTDILSSTQIICPRHVEGNKKSNTLNTIWCFVCSEGGNLICCETCPTSVHAECLPVNLLEDDTYICEDCESGRFPLYDEVVWVKCGTFRWWPAIILFPNAVPANVESKPHSKGEFVVKFFGTYNYFWVGRGRAFLYQEGDTGVLNNTKNKIDEAFSRALKEAADVYRFKKGLRAKKQKEVNNGLKPPSYVRIKVNRPVGNVKVFEGNLSNTTPCECDPKDKSPCGPNSSCLNRILLTECNPEICPAGQRCKNQSFEKREYPQVIPYRTTGRGWGLKTLEPIKKGRFVIEYVGEIIDDEEYQRRITRMHQQKDENYYFLTIDKDRMLDAGPKGNVARFMNHSCQPNCETQKWTVNGDTRVGLFAIEDIPADSELTFNYNLECVGTEKKICRCGAPNCSGFIGVKPEDQKPLKKNSSVKSVEPEKPDDAIIKDSCFVCGKGGDVGRCSNKTCFRSYHLECVQLDSWPNGKWNCPSHSCNICSKRTSRICVLCNNSYCPFHSNGNIRHDDSLGFLCSEHDQINKRTRRSNRTLTGLDTPQKEGVIEGETSESLRSKRYRKRTSETNEPTKRLKLDK